MARSAPSPSKPRLVGGVRLSPHLRLSVGYETGVVDMALTETGDRGARSMWAFAGPAAARAAAGWLLKAADLAEIHGVGQVEPPAIMGSSAARRQRRFENALSDKSLVAWRTRPA